MVAQPSKFGCHSFDIPGVICFLCPFIFLFII